MMPSTALKNTHDDCLRLTQPDALAFGPPTSLHVQLYMPLELACSWHRLMQKLTQELVLV